MNHEPPTHLDGIAKQKWAEIIDVLQARGDTLDAGVLTAVGCYAVASSQWTEASLKVQELGLIVKSPQGFPQENPYATIARKAMTELRRWGEQLQLTPKAKRPGRKKDTEPESSVAKILRGMDENTKPKKHKTA